MARECLRPPQGAQTWSEGGAWASRDRDGRSHASTVLFTVAVVGPRSVGGGPMARACMQSGACLSSIRALSIRSCSFAELRAALVDLFDAIPDVSTSPQNQESLPKISTVTRLCHALVTRPADLFDSHTDERNRVRTRTSVVGCTACCSQRVGLCVPRMRDF